MTWQNDINLRQKMAKAYNTASVTTKLIGVNLSIGTIVVTAYDIVSTNLALDESHAAIEVDTAGVVITIPATGDGFTVGRPYQIINHSTGNITATCSALISGLATQTLPTGSAMSIICNGTTWSIY